MPYIKQTDRRFFDEFISDLSDNITSEGDMNYVITSLIHKRIEEQGKSYQVLNDLIGVLECAKLELYRIIVAPYEDIKIEENGAVSEL